MFYTTPVPGCKYRSVVSKDSSCVSRVSFLPYGCHISHLKYSNNKLIKCCGIVEPVDFPVPVNFDVTFFDLHQKEVVLWLDQSLLPTSTSFHTLPFQPLGDSEPGYFATNIDEKVRKKAGMLFSARFDRRRTNPFVYLKIWKQACIPCLLFGSEL